jgi:cell division septation protein DedD
MQWDSHSRLSSTVKLTEAGCYRGVIQIGDTSYKVNPMSIPISPEFIYDRDEVGNDRSAINFGEQTLNKLAAISGGQEVLDIREIFDRSDRHHFISPVIGAFILAYLLLLLLEIAEARFAMLITIKQWYAGAKTKWRYSKPIAQPAEQAQPQATARTKTGKPVSVPHTPPSAGMEKKPTPAPSPAQPEPEKGSMAYLAKSKDRAKKKLQK